MNGKLMQAKPLLAALCCGVVLVGGLIPGLASAGGAKDKVTLCHAPPGNPGNAHTLVVGAGAVSAHLKNHPEDYLGPCVEAPECLVDDQCNDANPCTVDTCTPAGTCDYSQPVVCASDNPCANDVCIVEQGGCVAVPLEPGSACDDGDICTADACDGQGACVGTGVAGCCLDDQDCNDGNACTNDLCTGNACSNPDAPMPEAPACFVFVCDPEIGGINVDVPVTCVDDGDICTVEACDPNVGTAGACVTTANPYPPEGSQEVSCEDGLDNDCDGLVDSADADCAVPMCLGEADGTVLPDPDDCAGFIQCSGGKDWQSYCPPGLLFDATLGVCNWGSVVDCGDRPLAIAF